MDKLTGFNRKDVDELSGVSIFRDGIRVLPYGEKGNDWLGLDNERIQDTSFIGNDTIIGMVEIDQIENTTLVDKANREGLIENKAYEHFTRLVFACVQFLHREKNKEKKKEKKIDESKKTINNNLDKIKQDIDASANELSGVNSNFDNRTIQNLEKVKESVGDVQAQFTEAMEEMETSNKRLFHLAGTGLAAERFTHEFSRLVAGANDSLERLKKQVDISEAKIKKEIDAIGGALEALRNDIRLLGPVFYIKKVANEKVLDLRDVIDNSALLMDNAMQKAGINHEIIGQSFNIKMREGSCMQIFVNILDNSVYWLSRKSEIDNRQIKIILDSPTNSVYVTDNGPGVVSRYMDKIFEPFFSMKGESGRGLGLYIAREILGEKNWNIILVNKDDYQGLLSGASFKIIFTNPED